MREIDYSLYLVTDRELMRASSIEEAVEEALKGGCTLVQLREKTASSLEFYEYASRVKRITEKYNVPLIINDRVDIAVAVHADGVHVGQSDLPVKVVREIVGEDMIIGASVTNLSEANQAMLDGADYLGVGAMFNTSTKLDAVVVSIDELIEIQKNIHLPIVVIGGINKRTLPEFDGIAIDGIAVVSAVISQEDISQAAADLKRRFLEGRK